MSPEGTDPVRGLNASAGGDAERGDGVRAPESREARLARLLKRARELPEVPGVYLMKDSDGEVIYVGKALRLPDRVSSYFVPSADLGVKKQPMLDVVADFDIIECETEWEALLTENRLVKDLKPPPRYNVRLKDDKTFPYLVVTQREDYPRVYVTRDPRGVSAGPYALNARIFGPFANAGALREAVTLLQRAFKFRTCSLDIVHGDERNRLFRPCLLHAINQCTAPCAERIGTEAYRQDVDRFVRFISGKRSAMLRELRGEMERASAALEFERAAALRDQIRSLEKLNDRASIDDGYQPEAEVAYAHPRESCEALAKVLGLDRPARFVEAIDIAHLQGNETVGSKVCFMDGRPFKDEYRRFKVRTVANDDYSAIREVVSRRYRDAAMGHELFPDVVMIDGGQGQLNAAMEVFADTPFKPATLVSLAKKEELVHVLGVSEPLRLPRNNKGLKLLQAARDEAHRFAQAYHHTLRRKRTLGDEV
ncbi:MAG: excinuclease ABC subunit UvrC [Phycisphaerales bacterium]